MRLIEMFPSIQGEGSFMGVPVIFIRLGGCNLHCPFCDTKNSWGNQGEETSVRDIIFEIQMKYQYSDITTVVITGGEPTINPEISDLAKALKGIGYNVHMETNGTGECDSRDFDWIVCSPKEESNYKVWLKANELKYVVTPSFDIDTAIPAGIRKVFAGRIWLQPEGSDMQEMWKKCYQLAMKYPKELRVGIQLHKIMEVQ